METAFATTNNDKRHERLEVSEPETITNKQTGIGDDHDDIIPATATRAATTKKRKLRGGAPSRQSYSHFTKVSLVKLFKETKEQKSYANFLLLMTKSTQLFLESVGLDNPTQVPPPKTFRKWLVDEKILQAIASNCVVQPNLKRQRKPEFPEIESELKKYMTETGEASKKILQNKALEIAQRMNSSSNLESPSSPLLFAASNGWMQKVLKRHREEAVELQQVVGILPHYSIGRGASTSSSPCSTSTAPLLTHTQAMDCIIQLSNYADHVVHSKTLKNVLGQVSLTMAKIQHAKHNQQQQQQQQQQHR